MVCPVCSPPVQDSLVRFVDGSGAHSWYALTVRANAEKRVATALQVRGYDPYLPLYRKRSRWSDRTKVLDRVLFSGYVFCRFSLSRRAEVTGVPGVASIVGFGSHFASIPDEEIEAVRRLTGSGLPTIPWPFLTEGDRIRVVQGPLAGVEGLFCRSKQVHRIVVSVSLLQRSVAAEVDRDWIEPVPLGCGGGRGGLSLTS